TRSMAISCELTSTCNTPFTGSSKRFASAVSFPGIAEEAMKLIRNSCQNGFTLIEFMIASLLAMGILAATFTLITNVFVANTSVQQILTTQQNLRVAMNAITRDITMAGTGLPDSGLPIPNGTNSVQLARPGLGIACAPATNGCLPTPNNVIALISPGDG